MAWFPHDKEVKAVLSLDAPERYDHWIKKVADQREVWSLWQDSGWALAESEGGEQLVPVWPHANCAALAAEGLWQGYEPKAIPLQDWLDRWLPGMKRDKRLVSVFPTPEN